MRKVQELDNAVGAIKRLLSSGGLQLVHDDRVRKALQKLEREARSRGPQNGREIVRSVAIISEHLCDVFLSNRKT